MQHTFLFCTVQYCPRWSIKPTSSNPKPTSSNLDRPTPHGICTSSKKDPTLFDGLLIRAGTNNRVNSAPLGVEFSDLRLDGRGSGRGELVFLPLSVAGRAAALMS